MKLVCHVLLFGLLFIIYSTNIFIEPKVYSGTIDPSTSDQAHIDYGKDFVYVGRLSGIYEDNSIFFASAVAIDDHHILTASHVVQTSKMCTVILNNKIYKISKIICHPDFSDKKFGKADIAIGYSDDEFGLSFYPELYIDEDETGKLCSIAGYGSNGSFISGAIKLDQHRRAGSNTIDRVEDDLLICSPSSRQDKNKTALEFLIASGDSGGGLFITNKLAGINSCVTAVDKKTDSTYTDYAGHTRVSKFAPWIKANLCKTKK